MLGIDGTGDNIEYILGKMEKGQKDRIMERIPSIIKEEEETNENY